MQLRLKLAIAGLVLIAAYFYIKWDDKHSTYTVPMHTDVKIKSTSSRVIVTLPNSERLIVPNYGHGIEVVRRGDVLTYKPITHGWGLTPGFSTDLQRVGLSVEIGFYKRLSLIAGSNFFNLRTQQWDVRFHGGIAYRLPWGMVDNISIYSGISSTKEITGGVFVRFGGS